MSGWNSRAQSLPPGRAATSSQATATHDDHLQVSIHADMTVKEHAIAKTKPLKGKPGRYQPPDALLAFLKGL